jgi:2-succinyl-6-hydroxy-2,4-cyclohexadiene-1-carboxylate synthase
MEYSANLNLERYRFFTDGWGEPLVMLHGFTGTTATWSAQVKALQTDFEIIRLDLLGHGGTVAPQVPGRYSIKSAARDLLKLLDNLRLDTVNLVGYSMGGRLALYMAYRYPERIKRLILESASPGLRTEAERAARAERDNALADRIIVDGITAFVDYWGKLPLWASQADNLDAAAKAVLRRERLAQRPVGLANSLRGMGTGIQPSLWDDLSAITVPALLLAGELDTKFVEINQQMADTLPNARLEVVPSVGHTIHLEAPDMFNQHLREFIR